MEIVILGGILVINIALFAVVITFTLRLSNMLKEFKAFVTAPEEGKPSPLALTMDAFGQMFARSVVAQAKATFMGIQSGERRASQAVAGDMAEAALGSNPAIGAIIQSFPALRKVLRKNPGLVDLVISKFAQGGLARNASTQPIPSNGSKSDDQMKLI